jgi:hypothetical protein
VAEGTVVVSVGISQDVVAASIPSGNIYEVPVTGVGILHGRDSAVSLIQLGVKLLFDLCRAGTIERMGLR